MIRRRHGGENLRRLEDVLADRPVHHPSGRVLRPLTALATLREKIVSHPGEIQVGLLIEIRDVYLDAIRAPWRSMPAAQRASLRARLPEIIGPGEEFESSAARLAAVVDEILTAHRSASSAPAAAGADLEYITPAERAQLAAVFEQEVE